MTQQERLNRLGEQWSAAKDDPDKRKRLEDEIFTLALSIFGKFRVKNTGVSLMEGIVEFIAKDWAQFDAAKGSLYGFFQTRLYHRAVNEYRRQHKETDAFSHAGSLDAPISPGEETDAASLLDQRGTPDEYPSLHGSRISELMAIIIHFQERLRGRAKNPE